MAAPAVGGILQYTPMVGYSRVATSLRMVIHVTETEG